MTFSTHQELIVNDSPFGPSDEWAAIIADARGSEGKSPHERAAMFRDLLATVDAVWASLPPEERARRMRISDEIHRSPQPWWRNLRPEAMPKP